MSDIIKTKESRKRINLVKFFLDEPTTKSEPAIVGPIGPPAAISALPNAPRYELSLWTAIPDASEKISKRIKLPPRIIALKPCPISWNHVPKIVNGYKINLPIWNCHRTAVASPIIIS